MKVEIRKLSNSERELEIEVSANEFSCFFDEAILNLSRSLEIPGFRKGKIPKEIIQKEIGLEKILKEAAELAIKENYLKAMSENKIEPLGKAEIAILKLAPNDSLRFRARVTIFPEIELPDYKKIASGFKKQEVSVSEREIADTLSWIQKSKAKFTNKNGPANKGDFVEFEYNSLKIENDRKLKDNFILGEGHLIPGFEENLEGMRSGEEKKFSLSFPRDYFQKNLAGEKVDFNVKMISVQKMEISELSNDFVRSLGDFTDLAALKNSITNGIKTEKSIAESNRLREEIIKNIADKTQIEIPEILIKEQKLRYLEDLKERVRNGLKTTFEDYLKEIKKNENEVLDSFSDLAKMEIKNTLILKEIQKQEKIGATEEEMKEKTNEILRQYPNLAKLDVEKLKDYSKEIVENEKVFQFLESFTI